MRHTVHHPIEALVVPLVSVTPQLNAHLRPMPDPEKQVADKIVAAIEAEAKHEIISGAIAAIDQFIMRRLSVHDTLGAIKKMQAYPSIKNMAKELAAIIGADSDKALRSRTMLRAAVDILSSEMHVVREVLARAYGRDYAEIMEALGKSGYDIEHHSGILAAASSKPKVIFTIPAGSEVSFHPVPQGGMHSMNVDHPSIRTAIFVVYNQDDILAEIRAPIKTQRRECDGSTRD